MKIYNKITILLAAILSFTACEKTVLDLSDPSSPTDVLFFETQSQLEVALAGVYESLNYVKNGIPFLQFYDTTTDLAFNRGNTGGTVTITTGGVTSTDTHITDYWNRWYEGIQRANNLLANMSKAEAVTDPARFSEIRGEALALRAILYMYLTELYGDVPFRTDIGIEPLKKTPKSEIVASIMADLTSAADILPDTWSADNRGRVSGLAAHAYRARIALYNGDWAEAEASSQVVMNSGAHSLDGDYSTLFTQDGIVGSEEVMFDFSYVQGTNDHELPIRQGSRFGGWATLVPSQQTVDSYETVNGLPIDEDPDFDPSTPYENRDPRLKASIVVPGEVFTNRVFDINSTVTEVLDVVTGEMVPNTNATNRFATFTGYQWRKFTDEASLLGGTQRDSEQGIIALRYAEMLYTYAEARIESGNIDQSVLDAINEVRARAYGTTLGDTENYPAITTTSQSELRQIIRRERKVEFANEGLRLFDIRRWQIAEKVMNGWLYGSPTDGWSELGGTLNFVPSIDEDGFIDYSGAPFIDVTGPSTVGTLHYRRNEERSFNASRDYLWPIPQSEIDATQGVVTQNPGY